MKNKTNDIDWPGCNCLSMEITNIKINEEFSSIFPIKQELVDKIADSIIKNGYDKSQPLLIWEYEDEKFYLVDGHTRMKAAEKLGLETIPVIIMPFNTFKEARCYAVKRQVERRNLSQSELLEAAKQLANKTTRDGSGRSAEILSKELGVSSSTLVHTKAVIDKASEDDINAIKNGKETINSVYQKIRNKKLKKNDNSSKIDQQKSQSISTLVNINDILILLKNHNETNAIKIILEKYKDKEINF